MFRAVCQLAKSPDVARQLQEMPLGLLWIQPLCPCLRMRPHCGTKRIHCSKHTVHACGCSLRTPLAYAAPTLLYRVLSWPRPCDLCKVETFERKILMRYLLLTQ